LHGVIAREREPAVRTIAWTKEREMARRHLVTLVLVVTAAVCAPVTALGAEVGSGGDPKPDRRDVIVIAHRGASGSRPEHTLAAYRLAIKQCADFIEPDLVSTRDHVLVARHENDITGTTDVADHPEFADRRTTKVVDGVTLSGWFMEDFTRAELETLRAKERIPDVRHEGAKYDGRYEIPTLAEVLDLARRSRTCKGKRVGVYPETKHPSYFDSIGLSLEEPLVEALDDRGYRGRRAPVYIQSFEVGNLQQLRAITDVRLAQLVSCGGQPWDFTAAADPRTYADLLTPTGLDFVRTYADAVAVCKDLVIPRDDAGNLAAPTAVVADAHARRLVVHPWTFRRENQFLPTDLRRGADPNSPGDLAGEIGAFRDAEIDGFFTDNPEVARRA
jgi:glycerophosphoryl diester phosphodiesterase